MDSDPELTGYIFIYRWPRLKQDLELKAVPNMHKDHIKDMPGGAYAKTPNGAWYYKPVHRKEDGYRHLIPSKMLIEEHQLPKEIQAWALILN